MIARHYQTGRWTRVAIDGGRISEVAPAEGPGDVQPEDDWMAPAFADLQVNGRWGVSFADPTLTPEQVAAIVRAQATLGTARVCPTLISAPAEVTDHALRTIAEACDRWPDVAVRVWGIHLEGPYLSHRDGYRGAHPVEAMRDPDGGEFRRWQDLAGGRIRLLTLAPERAGAIGFIEQITPGVVVAIGHTAADGPTIIAAVEAGASLSTHLGNGIAATLPRHPNPIWEQAAIDRLHASLIGDGHHLDPATLRVLARVKGRDRLLLVSDASPLAGLSPGRYGEWEVDPSGKVVVAGTPYLAGSNQGIAVGVSNLIRHAGLTVAEAIRAATTIPARLIGTADPEILPGRPANLIRFRLPADGPLAFELGATCVDGTWVECKEVNHEGTKTQRK